MAGMFPSSKTDRARITKLPRTLKKPRSMQKKLAVVSESVQH